MLIKRQHRIVMMLEVATDYTPTEQKIAGIRTATTGTKKPQANDKYQSNNVYV